MYCFIFLQATACHESGRSLPSCHQVASLTVATLMSPTLNEMTSGSGAEAQGESGAEAQGESGAEGRSHNHPVTPQLRLLEGSNRPNKSATKYTHTSLLRQVLAGSEPQMRNSPLCCRSRLNMRIISTNKEYCSCPPLPVAPYLPQDHRKA